MAEGILLGDKYYWTATQALSLAAILDEVKDPTTYLTACTIARESLRRPSASDRAWAHGSLAELEILGLYHQPCKPARNAKKRIVAEHCRAIVELMGPGSFYVDSTRRQFKRYHDHWRNELWDDIVLAALAALSPSAP